MNRTGRRVLRATVAALGVAATLLVCVPATVATATTATSTRWHTWSTELDTKRQTWLGQSHDACMQWEVTGQLVTRARRSGHTEYWSHPHIRNFALNAYPYNRCDGDYESNAHPIKVDQLGMSPSVYAAGDSTSGCSWNPSLGAGYPLSLTFAVTPVCGNHTRVAFNADYNPPIHGTTTHERFMVPGNSLHWNASGHWTSSHSRSSFCLSYNSGFSVDIDRHGEGEQFSGTGHVRQCLNPFRAH